MCSHHHLSRVRPWAELRFLGSDALREKHDTDSDTDAIPTLIQLLVEGVSATM